MLGKVARRPPWKQLHTVCLQMTTVAAHPDTPAEARLLKQTPALHLHTMKNALLYELVSDYC